MPRRVKVVAPVVVAAAVALPGFAARVGDAAYASLDMAPREAAGLVVACVGRERCLPGYRVARDGYVCHAVEFVAEGAGTLVLAGRRHRLSAGQVFSYGPGVSHRIESDAERPMVKYFVDFFGSDAAEACVAAGLGPPRVASLLEADAMRRLWEELLREARKTQGPRVELAAAYVRLILLKCRERAGPAAAVAASRGTGASRAEETLGRALRLIETRHVELNSLSELAAAARVDAAHLCRLFARFRRDTPQRCLVRRKLDTAARLLATEPVLVKEAAAAAGFADALHFSRVFRRAFGCSPRAFQERHRASIAHPRPD